MGQPTFVTLDEARLVDLPGHSDRKVAYQRNYFGESGRYTSDRPQGFRVTHAPHYASRAHFHDVDQYQIFFGADDTMFQRHETGPLLVHYTDAHTLYGPFSSGEKPFSFFTLRQHASEFKGYMPEDKEVMPHDQTKRHYAVDLEEWLNEKIEVDSDTRTDIVIEEKDDHLGAYRITAAPGAKFSGPSAGQSGGQYYLVVDGEVSRDDEALPQFTVGWIDPEDEPPVLVAGDDGARVLVLQFGDQAARRS